MRLSDLKTGQSAVILKVLGHGGFRRRIMEMGFVRGKRVEVLQNAPLKDPIKYKVMEYEVSLRRSEAQMIEVITEEEAQDMALQAESIRGTSAAEAMERAVDRSRKRINVALVGNPNSGKTSLFNIASGSHEHVGNYSGVTVGAKLGHMRYKGYEFNIYDLPGTYALSAYTPEEVYVRRQLFEHTPDVVVNVVTASNLERNLYLTTELIDINLRMVVALNMYDELQNDKAELDYRLLGEAADALLLMTYEWGYTYGPPLPVSPLPSMRRVLDYAVTEIDPSKLFLGISNYGYDFTLPYVAGESRAQSLSTKEAVDLAVRVGAEIQYDETAMAPFFFYTEAGVQHQVYFEDARSIRAKLLLLPEYGLRGALYWNLMRRNEQNLLMLNYYIDILRE